MVGLGTSEMAISERVVVQHQVAADKARAVAQPVGWWSLAERSSSAAELIAPADTTTTSADVLLDARRRARRPPGVTVRPSGDVSSRVTRASVSSVTFGCCERRLDAHDVGVGLGLHQAGEAVAGRAADARAASPGWPRRA